MLFARLGIFLKDKDLLKYAKRQILLSCHFNLSKLISVAQDNVLMRIKNKRDINSLIEEFDKDDDLKNKRAQYLGLNSKLQTSIGFERDVIKIAKKEVKISEIEDYLEWAEEVISGILTEARKEGFLKKE